MHACMHLGVFFQYQVCFHIGNALVFLNVFIAEIFSSLEQNYFGIDVLQPLGL